jgi:DNA invertase Pin-like site-specific DNA recombinase
MKAILLGRVSTSKDAQASSSDRQLARLEEIAKRRGWTVVARFFEEESGRTMNRKAIQEALELVRRRRAQIIVVDHLFRFGRNAKEMLEAVDVLNSLGGSLYEAERELDTTGPLGRMVFTILAAVGEFYVRNNSQKIREGLERARQRGKVLGRRKTIDYGLLITVKAARADGRSWGYIAKTWGGTPGAWSRAVSRAAA